MAPAEMDELKKVVKLAVAESFEEQRNLIQSIVEEAIEDAFLSRAIEEGSIGDRISRDEVFSILDGVQ